MTIRLPAAFALALTLLGCATAAPPPAAPPPQSGPADYVYAWRDHFPEAARELVVWANAHPEAARLFFDWDAQRPERAREFVAWAAYSVGPLEAFTSAHPGWGFFDKITESHRPAAETFIAWCRRFPGQVTELERDPLGLSWAGIWLFR